MTMNAGLSQRRISLKLQASYGEDCLSKYTLHSNFFYEVEVFRATKKMWRMRKRREMKQKWNESGRYPVVVMKISQNCWKMLSGHLESTVQFFECRVVGRHFRE